MPDYKRIWLPGGTFFFTLVTNHRKRIFHEEFARNALREAFLDAKDKVGDFHLVAICLLFDHLHSIWTLPVNDADFSNRWRVIKAGFSRRYLKRGGIESDISAGRLHKGDVGVWQRRFWEHMIRDEEDLRRHIEYTHFNPVKHGLVQSVKDWPWSSFHQYVRNGQYDVNWGSEYRDDGEYDVNE